ncbi:MAG: ATP-grasp domain-containing protein, partial [Psychrobacter sp.]|nr:ATP-grasp domain-containing protein [Psychrobacter sp.]
MTSPATNVWLAEGQSSQRDMLASLQMLKSQHMTASKPPFTVYCSHRSYRPEIFEFADQAFTEPKELTTNVSIESVESILSDLTDLARWQFVLEQAQQHQVKVLLTGRNSIAYEAQRPLFEAAGIRLLTGATCTEMLEKIDDKFQFIQHCQTHGIPVSEGWRFDNLAQLTELLEKHGHQLLCVKPISGIFAQGFWILDTGLDSDALGQENPQFDSFEHLYFTDNRRIQTEQFISAYANSQMVLERPIPMLLMPYLAGREYSIDVVCERGEVLAAITRHKVGKVQHIGYDEEVMQVVIPLIKAFGCDGIVSVQTKQDDEGVHRVLEINSRPSGGIGYTTHSGVDLTQVGFGYWLGLSGKPNLTDIAKQIIPCQVRSIMVSV